MHLRSSMPDRPAAENDRRKEWLKRETPAKRLHHQHQVDRAATKAAVLFREWDRKQAEFGELRPNLRAEAALTFGVTLTLFEIIFVGDQPIDTVLEKPLLLREIEVHDVSGRM